tara:strand:+ start:391 stop:534 length:144 start_codon:yes stop_codon:yes gene_type:complete
MVNKKNTSIFATIKHKLLNLKITSKCGINLLRFPIKKQIFLADEISI